MPPADAFRLLVLSDLHYAPGEPDAGSRRVRFGPELLRRAMVDADAHGGFDAVGLLGDLLNAPRDDAAELYAAFRAEIQEAAGDVPLLVVPGNHDGPGCLAALGAAPGGHTVGGVRFFVFADTYDAADACTRPCDQREAFAAFANDQAGP